MTDANGPHAGPDSNSGTQDGAQPHKEPSLGPAILVIAILMLAIFCAVCGIGSWFMFSDQYPFAVRAVQEQTIPWVRNSQLDPVDKQGIISELEALIPPLEQRAFDKRQMTRLRNCLQDNPVLLWGTVQAIEAQAESAGLTETERAALERVTQRLLRAAAERKLSRNDLEFAIEPCAQMREDGQGPEVVGQLTDEQIRQFMVRAEQLVERNGIPNEAYGKTPAEAFGILVDAALTTD